MAIKAAIDNDRNKMYALNCQGNKKRQSASSRSSSSNGSDSDDGPPQVSTFRLTPSKAQIMILSDVLRTFNVARGNQDSCCPFHNAVSRSQGIMKRMLKRRCNPLWSPFTAAQCPHCCSMFDEVPDPDDLCDNCGLPFGDHDVSPESTGSTPNSPTSDDSHSSTAPDRSSSAPESSKGSHQEKVTGTLDGDHRKDHVLTL